MPITPVQDTRFIPVYTGNITGINSSNGMTSVYPCVYREHAEWRMEDLPLKRFIPVCTGNIFCLGLLLTLYSVYPCVYREHLLVAFILNNMTGLSLCVQGTLFSSTI